MADRGFTGGLTRAELARVVAALSDRLVGAQVQKVRQPRETAIVVECRARGESLYLQFSVHAKFPRVVPVAQKPADAGSAGPFCMLLRKRLAGGRVVEIAVDRADRIVTLNVSKRDEDLEEIWTLVAELIGAKGNLLLIGPDGRVVESLVPKRLSMRRVQPGDIYEPPTPPASPAENDRGLDVFAMAEQLDEAEQRFEFESYAARLSGVLSRERKRIRKYVDKLKQEFEGLPDAATLTKQAETLLSFLHLAKKGQTSVSLPNLYEPDGEPLLATLDPAKSPKENVEAMFKSARRTRRKVEGLRQRINEMNARSAKLAAVADELEQAPDVAALTSAEQAMRAAGVKPEREKTPSPAQRKKEVSPGAQPFIAEDGARIYVGRSARENEELIFRVARGNDFWLHVDGVPGSHVIVKLPPSGELNSETLLDAANLAVLHSSLKSAGAGGVHYTRCKHVRRPKNAPTGQVLAGSSKSIFIRLEDRRIARLYASRG